MELMHILAHTRTSLHFHRRECDPSECKDRPTWSVRLMDRHVSSPYTDRTYAEASSSSTSAINVEGRRLHTMPNWSQKVTVSCNMHENYSLERMQV